MSHTKHVYRSKTSTRGNVRPPGHSHGDKYYIHLLSTEIGIVLDETSPPTTSGVVLLLVGQKEPRQE